MSGTATPIRSATSTSATAGGSGGRSWTSCRRAGASRESGGSTLAADRAGGWAEDAVGMNVLGWGERWENGGAVVLHSPWWIRAHWGRAFEILELRSRTQSVDGVVLMRRRDDELTPADLEAAEPGEPREL